MEQKLGKIQQMYAEFHRELLAQGRLMVKDTEIGYWGVSPINELVELFKQTKLMQHKQFIDLGSGDGRAVLIAHLFTKNATGVEFDKELHQTAQRIAKTMKINPTFHNKDFHKHSLKGYDYVFIHPDQHIKGKLEEKIHTEMDRKAKLVVFGPHFHPESLKKTTTLDIHGTLASVFTK